MGLDWSYLVNPTVKLDFTVHPDFAQVESDDLVVNLTRFSVRLPEKCQFFLEAQNFFDFPLDGFAIDEVVTRMNFSVTPKLFGAVFAQWNNDTNEVLFNFRVTWIPKPGANVYFVLNEFGETLNPRWRLNKTVAMIKFVWTFDTK